MKRYYELDDTGHIAVTAAWDGGESGAVYDFPANFDFSQQGFYMIVNGVLTEDTEKRAAEEQRRSEEEREAGRIEAQMLYTAMMTDTLLEE